MDTTTSGNNGYDNDKQNLKELLKTTVPYQKLLQQEPESIRSTITSNKDIINLLSKQSSALENAWKEVYPTYRTPISAPKHDTISLHAFHSTNLEVVQMQQLEHNAHRFLEGTKEHSEYTEEGVEKIIALFHGIFTGKSTMLFDPALLASHLKVATSYSIGERLLLLQNKIKEEKEARDENFAHDHLLHELALRVKSMQRDIELFLALYAHELSLLERARTSFETMKAGTDQDLASGLSIALGYATTLATEGKLLQTVGQEYKNFLDTQREIYHPAIQEEITPVSNATSEVLVKVTIRLEENSTPFSSSFPNSGFRNIFSKTAKKVGLLLGTIGIISGTSYALKHIPTTNPSFPPMPVVQKEPAQSLTADPQPTIQTRVTHVPRVIKIPLRQLPAQKSPSAKPSIWARAKQQVASVFSPAPSQPKVEAIKTVQKEAIHTTAKPSFFKKLSNTFAKKTTDIKNHAFGGHLSHYTTTKNHTTGKISHFTYLMASDKQMQDLYSVLKGTHGHLSSLVPVAYATDAHGVEHRYVGSFVQGKHGGKAEFPTNGEKTVRIGLEINSQTFHQLAMSADMAVSQSYL